MNIILIIEYIAVVVFAITGVITAIEKKLDIFGATVLGFITALGGGMLRDVFLGYLPPAIFRDPGFAITSIAASVITFIIAAIIGKKIKSNFEIYSQVINILDSIGLSLFVVAGVQQAHNCGFKDNLWLSVFVGVLTGVGGGIIRDMMAGKVPTILKKRIYALAALPGALIYQILTEYDVLPQVPSLIIGAGVILILRICATVFRWNMPRIEELAEDE